MLLVGAASSPGQVAKCYCWEQRSDPFMSKRTCPLYGDYQSCPAFRHEWAWPAGISNSFQGIKAPDQLLTKMKRKMVVMKGTHGLPEHRSKERLELSESIKSSSCESSIFGVSCDCPVEGLSQVVLGNVWGEAQSHLLWHLWVHAPLAVIYSDIRCLMTWPRLKRHAPHIQESDCVSLLHATSFDSRSDQLAKGLDSRQRSPGNFGCQRGHRSHSREPSRSGWWRSQPERHQRFLSTSRAWKPAQLCNWCTMESWKASATGPINTSHTDHRAGSEKCGRDERWSRECVGGWHLHKSLQNSEAYWDYATWTILCRSS